MSEWFLSCRDNTLSRRDSTIVARHEVPREQWREAPSRRDGRSHCQSHRLFIVKTGPRSVQSYGWDWAIFLVIPGTSCLATFSLSLRDKTKRLALS